ncbi:MAG: alpha/beta hydrolase-fold protein, partial [Bacteroidia bacterium]|nr:alpha/beta hydrolase-fold protein [Bacteroidia bacterium]
LPEGQVEFKFTRGYWTKVESNLDGSPRANSQYSIKTHDSIYLKVEAWEDLMPKSIPVSTASENVSILSDSFFIPQLDRYRRIWIYLPPGYNKGRTRYPVIYMQDGQNLFDASISYSGEWKVDETMNQLARENNFKAIVVGIDHGGEKRIEEYTPWQHKDYPSGQGGLYVDFLVNDLKPFIDTHYRTRKGAKNSCIAGSSLGGLIATYAGIKYPKVFGKIASFSPAYWINPQLFAFAEKKSLRKGIRVYQVMAKPEGENHITDMEKMGELMKENHRNPTYIKTTASREGGHNEQFWAQEFREAILFLFQEP